MDIGEGDFEEYSSGVGRKGNGSPRTHRSSTFKPYSKVVEEKLKKPPKRKMSFQQYYNRMTQCPKMTTKTRFRWKYKNRLCVEQKTVQLIGGRQVPVSRQMLYMTDSSDDNEQTARARESSATTQAATASAGGGRDPETRSNMSEDEEERDESQPPPGGAQAEEIEWDYSDIKLTVDEQFGGVDGYVEVKGQILPNFELFDDVAAPSERPKTRRRTERRSRKSRDEKSTEIVTKFGYHITGNLKRSPRDRGEHKTAETRNVNRSASTRSDSGYLDVISGSSVPEYSSATSPKRETSLDETEDDIFAQRSLSQSRDSELNGYGQRFSRPESSDLSQDDAQGQPNRRETFAPTPLLHQHSSPALSTAPPRFSHAEDDFSLTNPRSISSRDSNAGRLITEQDFEDSLDISSERRDRRMLKNRSRSLEQFTEQSSFYDSLEGSPRSRQNRSMEFINEHYDISCSLCKLRKKCHHKRATGITHPMGTLRRENAFIKEETGVKSDSSDQESPKSKPLTASQVAKQNANYPKSGPVDTENGKTSSPSSSPSERAVTPRSARSWHRPDRKHQSIYSMLSRQTGEKFEPATPRTESLHVQRFNEHLARRERSQSAGRSRINLFRSASFNDNLHAAELASRPKIQVRRSPSLELVSHVSTGSPQDKPVTRNALRERNSRKTNVPQLPKKCNAEAEARPTPEMQDKSTQHEHTVTSDDSDCIFETRCHVTLTQSLRDRSRKKGTEKNTVNGREHYRETNVSEKPDMSENELNLTQDSLETSTSTTSSYTNTSTYTSTSSTSAGTQPDITHNPARPGKVAILDFSETVPTVTVKSRNKEKSNDREKSEDKPEDCTDCSLDNKCSAITGETRGHCVSEEWPSRRVLAPNVIVPAVDDVPSEDHNWSLDASEHAQSSGSDDGSDTPTDTSDAMLRMLIPVHMYRSNYVVDCLETSSFMELWFSQLLGMHRTILLTKLMDYFSRWRVRKKRHVSVFYRDNFLVVSDRSDSMDQSDGPSFDLSWSPEFMSTPRDVLAMEGQGQGQAVGDDFNDSSMERSQNVSEALAKLTSHRKERKHGEGARDTYAKYERTRPSVGGYARQFKDLEFSFDSSGSTAENTSVWDSHIDSGYEMIHERKRDRSQDAIYNSSSCSDDSSATFCCEDHEDQEMTFNSTISPNNTLQRNHSGNVVISQGDTIIVDGKGRGKRRYATTIVISKSENSDGTGSEYSDAESIASTVSSSSHRYVSAYTVPSKKKHSDGLRKVYISRPTNLRPGLELGLHRYVCLDMPFKIYPETDVVGDVLPIEHMEADVSGSYYGCQQNVLPWVRVDWPHDQDPIREVFRQNCEVEVNESFDSTLSQDSADITDVTRDLLHEDGKSVVAAKPEVGKDDALNGSFPQPEILEKYRVELQIQPETRLQCENTLIGYLPVDDAESESGRSVSRNKHGSEFHPWPQERSDGYFDSARRDSIFGSDYLEGGTSVKLGNMAKINNPALEGYKSFAVPFIDEPCEKYDESEESTPVRATTTNTWDQDTCVSSLQTDSEVLSTQPTSTEVTTDTSESESRPAPKRILQTTRSMLKKPPLPKSKSADDDDSGEWAYSVTLQYQDDGGPVMSYDPGLGLSPYHFDSRLRTFYQQLAAERQQVRGAGAPYEEMETNFGAGTSSDTSTESQGPAVSLIARDLDLAHCPVAKVVDHILGGNQSADDTFMQFKGYTDCLLDGKQQFDASLHETLNDTEGNTKINQTMGQLEGVTKILRVMDFASDGVDILQLLKKLPRSKSCPDLSMSVHYNDPTVEVKDGGKRSYFSGGSVYISKEEMELLENLSYSNATPTERAPRTDSRKDSGHRSADEAVSDQFSSSCDDREDSKPSSQQTRAIASTVDAQYNTDTGTMENISDIGGSAGTPCKGNSDEETTLTVVTNDMDSSEISQSTKGVKTQVDGQPLVVEIPNSEGQITVSEVSDVLQRGCFTADAAMEFDEEKSISVNVSFEIGYKQRVPSVEDLQKIIKDCKQIRDGLIQDVARLTKEMGDEIEQNVSDESLQIEWLYNDKSDETTAGMHVNSDNGDEILCVSIGRRNSHKLLDVLDKDLSMLKAGPQLAPIAVQEPDCDERALPCDQLMLSFVSVDDQAEANPIGNAVDHKQDGAESDSNSVDVPVTRVDNAEGKEIIEKEERENKCEDVTSLCRILGVDLSECDRVVEEEMSSHGSTEGQLNDGVRTRERLQSQDGLSSSDEIMLLQANSQASSTEGKHLTTSLTASEETLSEGVGGMQYTDDKPWPAVSTEPAQGVGGMQYADDKLWPADSTEPGQGGALGDESDVSIGEENSCEGNYSLLSVSSLSGGMPIPHVHYAQAYPDVSSSQTYPNVNSSQTDPDVNNPQVCQDVNISQTYPYVDRPQAYADQGQATSNDDRPPAWKGSVSDDEHIMYVDDSLRMAFALHVGMDLADLFSDEAFDDDEWHTDSSDDVKIRRSTSARELSEFKFQNYYYLDRDQCDVGGSQTESTEIDEQREEEAERLLSREPVFFRKRRRSFPESLSGDDNSNSFPAPQHKDKLLYIPPQGDFVVCHDGDAITDEEGNCNTLSECTGGRHDTTYSSLNTSTSYEDTDDGLVRSSATVTLTSVAEEHQREEVSLTDNVMKRVDNISAIVFQDSTLSHGSRHEVDYGKFYNTSYLEKPMGVAKGPSINPSDRKPTHFHRPENFSYSQVRTDFIRPMKKETSSMMSALGDATKVTKKRLEDFMEEPMKNKEVIDMAKFPDSQKPEAEKPLPIEREDWPAPAAAAAAFPELLYTHTKTPRRSRGESSEMDSTDGAPNSSADVDMEEEGEGEHEVDPKIQKDIEHLTRLESESGAAKVILEDLKKKAAEPPPLIDVISASRTPSASKEPVYRTRYESHVFASPSRDLDYHPRTYALDDQILGRKYRNALQSVGNYPVDRRGYERPSSLSHRKSAMKPGYTLRAPKTAHMPATFASARANGYFSDIEQCVTRDSDFDEVIERRSHKTPSIHTSQSSIEEYDPHTGLRRGGKLRGSSLSTDYSKTPFRKSISSVLNKDDPPKIYSYEELKLTNEVLPPGTDINWLEVHLEDGEFQSLFHMTREEFYRLAEWKRNDLKKRVLLF